MTCRLWPRDSYHMTRRLYPALRTFFTLILFKLYPLADGPWRHIIIRSALSSFLCSSPKALRSLEYPAYLFICSPPTATCAQRLLSPRLTSRVTRTRRTGKQRTCLSTRFVAPYADYEYCTRVTTITNVAQRSHSLVTYNESVAFITLNCGRLSSGPPD